MELLQCLAMSNTMRGVVTGCGLYLMLGQLPGIMIQDGLDLDILGLVEPHYDKRCDCMDDHFLVITIVFTFFYPCYNTKYVICSLLMVVKYSHVSLVNTHCQDFQMFCFPSANVPLSI